MDGLIQPTDDWMIVANHGCHRLYGRARLLGIGAGAAVAVAFAAIVIHGYLVPAKAEFRSVVQDVLADSNGTGLVVIRPAVMIFPILYCSGTLSPTNQLRLRPNDGVPERELLAARAMKSGLAILKPILVKTQTKPKGTVVIATVFGDLHDIGKNLVGMMLEGAGFKVIDLGVNTKADEIIETAKEVKADVVGLSALLTTTMPFMKLTIEAIRDEGLDIPVIIGGAPVSQEFADNVDAHGYGDNAPIAVQLVRDLISAQAAVA